jgi:putative ubiquitin-RnfH superfamily antitoxin RatB of RatAB toxin-antitoxin module
MVVARNGLEVCPLGIHSKRKILRYKVNADKTLKLWRKLMIAPR